MTDESNPPIPLEQRICLNMMTSGISGDNGTHPICMGRQCSRFESCEYDLLICLRDIDILKKHPRHRRITKCGTGSEHR